MEYGITGHEEHEELKKAILGFIFKTSECKPESEFFLLVNSIALIILVQKFNIEYIFRVIYFYMPKWPSRSQFTYLVVHKIGEFSLESVFVVTLKFGVYE